MLGSLFLDFTNYRFGPTPTEVDVSFAMGSLDVYVPAGVEVELNGSVDVGVADIFGDDSEGRALDLDGNYRRQGLTEGTLILNVHGGVGSVSADWIPSKDQEPEQPDRASTSTVKERGRDG